MENYRQLYTLLGEIRKELAGIKLELRRMNDENEAEARLAEKKDKGTAEPL